MRNTVMKKRIFAAIAVVILLVLALVSCGKEQNYEFTNKAYIYESLVNDGSFTIKINSDGTFEYSVSAYHVEITGDWEYQDNIITLKEPVEGEGYWQHKFTYDGENLFYVAEGSSGFPFATIADGDFFYYFGTN